MRPATLLALAALVVPASLAAAQKPSAGPAVLPTIAVRTAAMCAMPGLLPLFWDEHTGKIFLEIPQLAESRSPDFLYTDSLPYGTGSNDLGLDRGQTSDGRVVRFERIGPKILLVEPNQQFRSSASDPAERLAVRESFPESVLAGFTVEAEDPDHSILVDATSFFVRDSHGVVQTLKHLKQGSYKLDPARSTIALDHTKAFPRNTEVESILTFTLEDAPESRSFVAQVTPDPQALTVREHQSFLALPEPGFIPRRFDPRAGYFPTSYRDYAVPLSGQLDQQFITRHRLNKKDPSCRTACVAESPIQYYVDRGAPEPIRTALLEGARWWDQAFQAAGWAPGTFKVDLLPADADPMDVRYNIIQWVHRYTRGWSYGAEVADPRTGEIIKGNVTLGSLRARQDYLIAEALLSPYVTGKKFNADDDPMLAMVLMRIRQLAAHETGHTLGLAHNFAASTVQNGDPDHTISVMDYPHPWIELDKNGVPDLTHAYPVGIGSWDKVAIDYGYREFPARSNEHVELNKILAAAEQSGIPYLTDEDARPSGSASPIAHLWDNGNDPAAELTRILKVRQAALARFGENAIQPGAPLAQLEDTLVPLYLLHRYQTEAAIKEIGGLNYNYKLRGDAQPLPSIVPADQQRAALAAVLQTLTAQLLVLPEPLLKLFPPRPPGLLRTRESFASHVGLTFDPIAAAESSADLTLAVLLDPARASRLVEYHAREAQTPSLANVLEAISHTVAQRSGTSAGFSSEVERAVETRAYEAMFSLAMDSTASSEARAITLAHINSSLTHFRTFESKEASAETAHRAFLIERINEFQGNPEKFIPAKSVEAPPGMPIGEDPEL
jgi:hypothetical protein